MDIERLADRFSKLRLRAGTDANLCQAIERWLAQSAPTERLRLNPYALAQATSGEVRHIVSALLQGTQVGLFDLNWDVHCPHCNGLTAEFSDLSNLVGDSFCEGCRFAFSADVSEQIEVTFSLHREIEQLKLAPGCMRPEGGVLPRRMSGLELIHHHDYARLFGGKALSQRERLRITSVSLVFTDITGSTRIYEQIGDADAYNLVRDHFEFLREATEKYGGTVLKTIGDAMMASFLSNRAALLAIDESMQRLATYNRDLADDRRIRLRFGIHSGPAILVTLNERLDYFGRTVNKAARIQSVARSDEVSVSAEVFADSEFQRARQLGRWSEFRQSTEDLKGIAGHQNVYTARFTG